MTITTNVTLENQLVRLRASQPADYPQIRAMLSDLKTMAHLKFMANMPHGWTLDQVRGWEEMWQQLGRKKQALHFVLEEINSGQVVGNCGFHNLSLEQRRAEFGLIIHHPAWGRGISQSCHLLCLEYGFEAMKLHRIEWLTTANNIRMRRFLEGLGVAVEAVKKEFWILDGNFVDGYIYTLFEDSWPAVKQQLQERVAGHT